jgi:hypothetical protein
MAYRACRKPIGDFFASQMERLAQLVRFMAAKTSQDFDDRLEVLEADAHEQYFDVGYVEGLEAGRREAGRCRID